MKLAVIIPAAGASSRYSAAGGLRSKLDEDLGGRPVLQRTVELFNKLDVDGVSVCGMVVAGPQEEEAYREFAERHADRLALLGAKLCRGGKMHRWETVKAALEAISDDATHIAVHDAARPCASLELIERVVRAAEKHGAAAPGIEVGDTVKRVGETEGEEEKDPLAGILGVDTSARAKLRVVEETLERAGLMLIQTPQVFEAGLLRLAYGQKDLESTDDATLVERLGKRVVVVEGDRRNIKITRPADVDLARNILGVRAPEGRAVHKRF